MIEITRDQAERKLREGKELFCKDARITKINATEACLERSSGKLEYFPIGVVEYRMAKNRKWYV